MTASSLKIAVFGSSLVSSYWNVAARYYRGLLRALARRGHAITFYEPDAFGRQQHRDMHDPNWARVVVYPGNDESVALRRVTAAARYADVLVKASGVGVFDELLEHALLTAARRPQQVVFWDMDPTATLARLHTEPDDALHRLVPRYDAILTYGGDQATELAYRALGAHACLPVHDAFDPDAHPALPAREAYAADLALLAHWPPDPEARVAEYFFEPAQRLPQRQFLLAGSGWDSMAVPPNVRTPGELPAAEHDAVYRAARAVLHVASDDRAPGGPSGLAQLLQIAGTGACPISHADAGVERFLEPGVEVLIARNGAEVAQHLEALSPERALRIGAAARQRVLAQHCFDARARELEALFTAGAQAARFEASA
jgi:spore maturation protein CgeB